MATILLVEDNADLRESIRLRLHADRHRVVEAADGNTAIQLWREHHPDLIITDFRMPHLNGLEVIKAVCAQQPDIPIILMSAGMEEHVRVYTLKHFPSVRYLPKDMLAAQLRQSVKEASA
mgnify:CR=1 FL=1|jgi:CheY-like chemotaxis protein